MPEAGGVGGIRIGIALDDPTLEPDPVWTYLTDHATYGTLFARYEIDRSKSDEFQLTDTGKATATVVDREGLLDSTNTNSPLFGKIDTFLQIQFELLNPVDDTYYSRYRGFIDNYDYVVNSIYRNEAGDVVGLNALEISCVDLFEILTAIEMYPDQVAGAPTFGNVPPLGAEGRIFFQNATAHDRALQVLGNAGVPDAFYVVFTMNVRCSDASYDPGDDVLQVLQDTVNAEFPTVGNMYCDRLGRLAIHGRLAKFDPEGTVASATPGAWDFHDWKVGDETAVRASITDTAQMRDPYGFNKGRAYVYNYAYCTAATTDDQQFSAQVSRDDASIGQRGFRAWSAEGLYVDSGILTGNDADAECLLYAQYITANYAEPRERVTSLTIRSLDPRDDRAAATWALLGQIDVSDRVNLTVGHPGGGGFNAEPSFVEGLSETAEPLNGQYANVTLQMDVSPAAWFTPGAWSGVT